jgi:hypothetical protein
MKTVPSQRQKCCLFARYLAKTAGLTAFAVILSFYDAQAVQKEVSTPVAVGESLRPVKSGKAGENLLQYPGFENAEGWRLPATASLEPSIGRNGTSGLVIRESGNEINSALLVAPNILGSRDYCFRAWVKSEKGDGEGPKLKIEFYNHEGKNTAGVHSPTFSVGQYGTWAKVEVKVNAPLDTVKAVLMLCQFGSGESAFDDLEFTSSDPLAYELGVDQRLSFVSKGGALDSAAMLHLNLDLAVTKGMTAMVTVTDSKGDAVFTSEPQPADKKVLKFPFQISSATAGRYTVTARLLKPDASLLLEAQDVIAIVEKPASFTHGHYEVEGKPFFPIGIWHVEDPEKEFPLLQEAGFNTVQGNATHDLKELVRYMDLAEAHQIYVCLPLYAGMKVKENFASSRSKMRLLKDHPALLSYWLQDEPDVWQTKATELVELRWILNENDPKHPGSAVLFGTSTRFMELQQAVDTVFVDPYPKRKRSLPHTEVRDEIERAKKAGKPIAIAIQAFEWLPQWVKPSVSEFENYVYQALIHGVVGVTYYSLHEPGWSLSTSDLWPSVKEMNREIATLAPVLLSAEMRRASWSVKSNADIDWVAAIVNGETYLLAVNVTETPQQLNALLPEGTKGALYPLFDRAGAVLKDNRASEVIEGFGTRAYVIR